MREKRSQKPGKAEVESEGRGEEGTAKRRVEDDDEDEGRGRVKRGGDDGIRGECVDRPWWGC